MLASLKAWAARERTTRPDLVRIGVFGSLLRDDWGVGSDADLVVIVSRSDRPPMERPLDFDLSAIPVGADLLVYTVSEWEHVVARNDRFGEEMRRAQWL